MIKTVPLCLAIILQYAITSNAQTFVDLQNGFPTLGNAAAAWADYDNDGDSDFAVIGFSSMAAEISQVYRNDGGGVFTLADTLPFHVSSGSVSWGDFDNDGDPDLLISGQNGGGGQPALTTLYRNDSGSFVVHNSGLPGLIGVSRWIDYDSDGWLDVIMCGMGNTFTSDSTRLFHNDTNGIFTEIQVTLPGYMASDISIVDFDNDSDMDFFVTGGTLSTSTVAVTRLFRNDGNALFTQVQFNFRDLSTGTSAWADFDNDGDKDLLYDGIDSTASFGYTLIYRNDSAGNFTLYNDSLPGSGEPGSVDWADVDNDGDLDILLGGPTTLLRNDGGNIYTDITPASFMQSVPCSFADIDNDGDQDILLISQSGGFSASTIQRNDLINTAIEIANVNESIVYPNPAGDKISIHTDKKLKGVIDFKLFNVLNEEIEYKKINNISQDISIDISAFVSGIYFYQIMQNDRQINSGKIIIEK